MVRGDQTLICSLHHTIMTKHVKISYKDWFCLTLSKIDPTISFRVKSFRVTKPFRVKRLSSYNGANDTFFVTYFKEYS